MHYKILRAESNKRNEKFYKIKSAATMPNVAVICQREAPTRNYAVGQASRLSLTLDCRFGLMNQPGVTRGQIGK
jgi:hypothetical protein